MGASGTHRTVQLDLGFSRRHGGADRHQNSYGGMDNADGHSEDPLGPIDELAAKDPSGVAGASVRTKDR
jgi:hypothetical protein